MSRRVCRCGLHMERRGGFWLCLHCDYPPAEGHNTATCMRCDNLSKGLPR